MLPEKQQRRKDDRCLSDLVLDRLVVQRAREEAPLGEAQAHLLSCERCAQRFSALIEAHERFALPMPSALLQERRRFSRKVLLALPLAAALLLAFLLRPIERPLTRPGRKGSASFGVYVLRDQQVQRGHSGAVFFPKDRLRFYYSSDHPTYLAVFDVEPSGAVVPFVASGHRAKALPPGSHTILEDTVELDEALGPEVLVGLFCPEPFELEAPARALKARGAMDFEPMANCKVQRFSLDKRSR